METTPKDGRYIDELRRLEEENKRLRGLGRELFLLAEKTGLDLHLRSLDMWRYCEIGEVFAPDYSVEAPQA